jgi:hypothetical protein
MKLARINLIAGLLLVIASVYLYFNNFDPKVNGISETLNKAAFVISDKFDDDHVKAAANLLEACADFTLVIAPSMFFVLFGGGLMLLFNGLMYYRFNVLYQALNKGQQRTDKSVT